MIKSVESNPDIKYKLREIYLPRMGHTPGIAVVAVSIALLLFVGAGTVTAQQAEVTDTSEFNPNIEAPDDETVNVDVTVADTSGDPIEGALVELEDRGGSPDDRLATTGSNGEIRFVESVGPPPANCQTVKLRLADGSVRSADLGCRNGGTSVSHTFEVDDADGVSVESPDRVLSGGEFDFTVEMRESSVGEVAVESSGFGVELSVVDDAGDSIGEQTDTSVEFIDIDEETSTYTLKVNATGGSEGDTGTITAATGGNIGDSGVDDQASSTFSLADVSESPTEEVTDELWTTVTADDDDAGSLSLSDLGNAIQEYQDSPSDADVGGVSIGLSDLGSLIQYYQNEVV